MSTIPPLEVEFDVATSPEQAFATWVERAATWWPKGHTVSGDPAAVVFEPFVGGRIVERAPDGSEHVWGEIVGWDAPHRLAFRWHLFFAPEEATDVEITFTASASGTIVHLVQTGWDALGDQGVPRRERTIAGWGAVTVPYRAQFD